MGADADGPDLDADIAEIDLAADAADFDAGVDSGVEIGAEPDAGGLSGALVAAGAISSLAVEACSLLQPLSTNRDRMASVPASTYFCIRFILSRPGWFF